MIEFRQPPPAAPGLANWAVNGSMETWQRGPGPFSAPSSYGADRWVLVIGGTSTLSVAREATTVDAGSVYAAAMTYTHGNTACRLAQNLEGWAQLRGRLVALRVRVRGPNNGIRPYIWDSVNGFRFGPAPDQFGAYQARDVVAAIAPTATGVQIGVELSASGTFYVDSLMAVVGPVATAYAPATPADDFARCLGYYQSWGGTITAELVAAGQCYTTTGAVICVNWQGGPMRGIPTVTNSGPAQFVCWNAAAGNMALTGMSAPSITTRQTQINMSVASGLVAGNATAVLTNTTAARLNAEYNP